MELTTITKANNHVLDPLKSRRRWRRRSRLCRGRRWGTISPVLRLLAILLLSLRRKPSLKLRRVDIVAIRSPATVRIRGAMDGRCDVAPTSIARMLPCFRPASLHLRLVVVRCHPAAEAEAGLAAAELHLVGVGPRLYHTHPVRTTEKTSGWSVSNTRQRSYMKNKPEPDGGRWYCGGAKGRGGEGMSELYIRPWQCRPRTAVAPGGAPSALG